MITGIWSDLVFAARCLVKAPAFAFVCIVSLGIGMVPVIAVPYGARILRMPPPGVKTEGLVEVSTAANKTRSAANSWSYADFTDLRNANTGIAMFGWSTAPNEVTLPGGLKKALWPMYVSSDYFKTIGVTLARGPGFENQTGALVILGYKFWQDNLNSDPEIIGKTLKFDTVPFVVAGIAPERFEGHLGLQGRELFVPLERHPTLASDSKALLDRNKEWLRIHGRLSPGVSVAQASAAVAAATSQLAKEYPATNEHKAGVVDAYDPLGVNDRSRFVVLQAIALTLTGIVLLVVCLNISGMMQVRSAMRERELSIRQAIGASRARLARHLLAEAVLLAAAGGTLASLVLFNAPAVISQLVGQPLPFQDALKVDLSMIVTCIGICLLTSLVFGFLPALRFSRPVIISALKDEAGAGGSRVGRVHRFTAALQVAIAVPLLVIAGVCLDRVRSTATSGFGFESSSLYAAPLDLEIGPETRIAGDIDFRLRSLRDNLAKSNGVASVTVADGLPLDFRGRPTTVSLPPETNNAAAAAPPALVRAHVTRVGDGYLNTMGIPILGGRNFSVDDGEGAEMVTIITKPLADRLFPNGGVAEAIGKRLLFGVRDSDTANKPPQALTIVGVTGDFPTSQMNSAREQLLLPLAQHSSFRRSGKPVDEDDGGKPNLLLIARSTAGEQPQKMVAALENVVREFNPEFKRDRIITGASLRRNSVDDFLKQSTVAGATGGVILLLSALGIYGVVGLMVATRTREIAVRMALGASRPRVLAMILVDVVKLAAPGIGIGLLLAAVILKLKAEDMGIPLSNVETLAYAVGGLIALIVAALSGLAPARRAASVLPMVAMRSE